MNTSPEIGELAAALALAQGAMRNAPKDATNPHFRSSYASLASILDTIREPLAANELAIVQTPEIRPESDGRLIVMVTRLAHSSGQWIEGTVAAVPKDGSPQAVGSCITYLRRYGVAGLISIAAGDDDDGNASQGNQGNQWTAPKRQPSPKRQQRSEPKPKPEERVVLGLPGGVPRRAPKPRKPAPSKPEHHPSWEKDRPGFCAWCTSEGTNYDAVAMWAEAEGWGRPSGWPQDGRRRLRAEAGDWMERHLIWLEKAAP